MSMEHGKLNFVERGDSIFSGAIFMSNRETKRECLQRKLFGLPLAKFKFLKQIKAGMILFLFEHEERKLYGVFEATSDGALNIIPDAYRSTGQSYPAQILFKRIWMCKPLCEDEFCSAIEENYYSPNKFHFGLSYKQVIDLIHLFYSRKINIKQYKGRGIPNKIIEKFENTDADEVSLTETETYFKCRSDEYSREGKREVRRQLALPQVSLHPPILYKLPVSTRRGSNQVNLFPLSYPHNFYSESEILKPQRCSVCLSHDHNSFRHFSMEKQPSTTSEIEYEPLPLRSSSYMPNLDNMVAPSLSSLNCYSSPNNVACELPSNEPNMIPRMVMIQEEGAFASSHVMNDSRPQTEIAQHTCVSGALPNQVFEPSDYIPLSEESVLPNQVFEPSDYIPLSEESVQKLDSRENQNFSLENSRYFPSTMLYSSIPSASKKKCKYFDSSDEFSDDDDELKTCQRVEADEHNAVSRTLLADSDLSRKSVFSRLSRHNASDESSGGVSIDQLLNILSTRRNSWSAMEELEKPLEWGINEQFRCTTMTARFDHSGGDGHLNKIRPPPAQPVERSEIVQHDPADFVGDLSNDVLSQESFELPFYNFRRRNKNQKCDVQDYSNKHGDICGSEVKLTSKRRRIVRPSLYERCIISVKSEVEVETSAQVILESKNESKANVVAGLQNVTKYELVGESIEHNHETSMDGTLDYIPIE